MAFNEVNYRIIGWRDRFPTLDRKPLTVNLMTDGNTLTIDEKKSNFNDWTHVSKFG